MNFSPRIALFGAAPDTPNMGVSALYATTVTEIHRHVSDVSFVVFDFGFGVRSSTVPLGDGHSAQIDRRGAHGGLRLYRPENLINMSLASLLGPLGVWVNRSIREIDRCTAVLDVSGGDSFSDIYGSKRFYSVVRPKLIALRRGIPLILLPQTYGPFKDPRLQKIATQVVRGAAICWARDERSFDILRDMLGDCFDPVRHRCGVDLAFGLAAHEERGMLSEKLRAMVDADRTMTPLIGFNVSGLIYNSSAEAKSQYGLNADYRECVIRFLHWVLKNTKSNLVLIPHVMSQRSDLSACQHVARDLNREFLDRVVVSPGTLDQHQVKWLIGQTDWFCGTRMHSTIAALSSGVPVATVSYSDKALGVFESCGQGQHVIDPRALDTVQVVDRLVRSFENRVAAKESLAAQLPNVQRQFREQIESIANGIKSAQKKHSSQFA